MEISVMAWDQVAFNASPTVQTMPFLIRAAYRELLDLSWQEDGLPTNNEDELRDYVLGFCNWRDAAGELIESIPDQEWCSFIGECFPVASDGKRRNQRQERERENLRRSRERRGDAAARAARARWGAPEPDNPDPVEKCPTHAPGEQPEADAQQPDADACHTNTNTNTNTNVDKKTSTKSSSPTCVDTRADERVVIRWEYLRCHEQHYVRKNGQRPSSKPNLYTSTRLALIDKALKAHGVDRCRAAIIGLFRSPFHLGKNDDETEYLGIEYALRINRKGDNVERHSSWWSGKAGLTCDLIKDARRGFDWVQSSDEERFARLDQITTERNQR